MTDGAMTARKEPSRGPSCPLLLNSTRNTQLPADMMNSSMGSRAKEWRRTRLGTCQGGARAGIRASARGPASGQASLPCCRVIVATVPLRTAMPLPSGVLRPSTTRWWPCTYVARPWSRGPSGLPLVAMPPCAPPWHCWPPWRLSPRAPAPSESTRTAPQGTAQ